MRTDIHITTKKPNGVYIDLNIDRTIGFIRHIYVDCFETDEKGLPSNYLFRLTLQPI